MSHDPAPPEPRRGGSCKIRRDPSEDGSVPALLPRRCALRRATHGCTTRPTRPPKPLGSRPDVARSRPFRATARGIPQNKARSERRRVGTRPPPTSVRYTLWPSYRRTTRPNQPRNRSDLDRMSRDPGPSEPRRGGFKSGGCQRSTTPAPARLMGRIMESGLREAMPPTGCPVSSQPLAR